MLSAVGKQRLWTLQEMQAECCVQTKPSKQGVVQHEQAAAVLRDFCLILILLALSDWGSECLSCLYWASMRKGDVGLWGDEYRMDSSAEICGATLVGLGAPALWLFWLQGGSGWSCCPEVGLRKGTTPGKVFRSRAALRWGWRRFVCLLSVLCTSFMSGQRDWNEWPF